MRWAAFRVLFGVAMGALLLLSLAGIVLTGPVAVRPPHPDLDLDVSPQRLRADVEALCGRFAPRDHLHPAELNAAADWIAGNWSAAGLEVELQSYEVGGTRYRNVLGRRPGSDPEAGIFVLGAHYDAFAGSPGANDNASGVAVLLELARTLPAGIHRRTHLFVAFSTEEPPSFGTDSMGSAVLARHLVRTGAHVELMVSVDSVGFYSDAPDSQQFPFPGLGLFYPDRGNFIAVVGDLASGPAIRTVKRTMLGMDAIPVVSLRASPRWAPVWDSDQLSFRRLALPAVQLTDTARLRDRAYHTPEDTPERLDYERMAGVVRALHGLLWEAGGTPAE